MTTAIFNFWQYELCDIYIEYIKQDFCAKIPDPQRLELLKLVLYTCLNNGLRLLAPIMPYVSEELYQRLPKPKSDREAPASLCVTPYPQPSQVSALASHHGQRLIEYHLCFQSQHFRQEQIETDVAMVFESIKKIRSYRAANNIVKKTKDNRKWIRAISRNLYRCLSIALQSTSTRHQPQHRSSLTIPIWFNRWRISIKFNWRQMSQRRDTPRLPRHRSISFILNCIEH